MLMHRNRNQLRTTSTECCTSGVLTKKVRNPRAGVSLILVMFALSMSLVLTYSFIQTQTVLTQISENGNRRNLAINAARAGMADALNRLNSLEWAGVTEQYRREFQTDSDGTSSYHISFQSPGSSISDALELEVHSLGIWASDANDDLKSEYEITAKVRLVPRLRSRSILPGDSASATDQVSNPSNFDTITGYALFAEEGTNSLILDPCDRIDGNIWLKDDLTLFEDPDWNSSVRREFLQDVGNRQVTFPEGSSDLSQASLHYPHPIAGNITFYQYPSSGVRQDLSDLKVNWSTTTERPLIPATDFSKYTTYRLYAGGPEYQAVSVSSNLYNQSLKPTANNPLGIFYRSGSINVYDNVIIQGTLISNYKIYFRGTGIHLTAFNWTGDTGEALIPDSDQWPRLPTVIAEDIQFERETQTTIEGAVVCQDDLSGAGGSVNYPGITAISLTGTATATPIEQPFSRIKLQELQILDTLTADGNYAIWLSTTGMNQTGSTGTWYPIVGVDSLNQELTVRGEITHATPTSYQIKLHKRALTQIRGPVCAETYNFNRVGEWVLSTSLWSDRRNLWNYENNLRTFLGMTLVGFSEWLADPLNYAGWSSYYQQFGLDLEPTLHIQHLREQEYRWEPPLFQPYSGNEDNSDYAGYRWSLIEWNESP